MCDQRTVGEVNEYLRNSGDLTRRQFGKLSVGTGLAMLLPRVANAQNLSESDVEVITPEGTADCYFVHPSSGAHPAVLIWPDALGLRPAFKQMGKRLAESGYSVLVVNQYYRGATAPVVPEGASFQDPETREALAPLRAALNPGTHVTDATAFVEFLDAQPSVAADRKMGTTGYCMGGPITMRTAAALPERIGAAASFHGGGLVTDAPDSPHLLIPSMQASYLFAVAENDDTDDPEAKNVLREAFNSAGLEAEIEVYAGALHGWCPPDSAVYNETQAERAWGRLLVLFENTLV
jgi:carboxymethylenebutenolidase